MIVSSTCFPCRLRHEWQHNQDCSQHQGRLHRPPHNQRSGAHVKCSLESLSKRWDTSSERRGWSLLVSRSIAKYKFISCINVFWRPLLPGSVPTNHLQRFRSMPWTAWMWLMETGMSLSRGTMPYQFPSINTFNLTYDFIFELCYPSFLHAKTSL